DERADAGAPRKSRRKRPLPGGGTEGKEGANDQQEAGGEEGEEKRAREHNTASRTL
ncbi:MAG: hypothetical protein FD121_1660, partial [Gallionellaceae bacterium]